MSDAEFVSGFGSKIEELMRYVQSAEGIAAVLPVITLLAQQIARIVERDPELAPEMTTVIDSLDEAAKAAARAFEFASARLSVRLGLGEEDGEVLGRCPHGVDLDREFCPHGCRV